MSLQQVMQQERAALLGEATLKLPSGYDVPLPYAAVVSPDSIVKTPSWLRLQHPVTIEDLPGRSRASAFVQVCSSLGYKFLWVHADNDDYRKDYRTYLESVLHVKERLPADLHVDHLYNRERAKQFQTPWIRTILCQDGINTSHGAGYEKLRGASGIGVKGRDHTVDEITLMKLCGIPSPKKAQPLSGDMMKHVFATAQLFHISAQDIEASVKNLMEVATFKPKNL